MKQVLLTFFTLLVSTTTILAQFEQVPLRADSCFDFKLNYEFKQRPLKTSSEVNYMKQYQKQDVDLLPYVAMQIELGCFSENEFRVKVVDNRGENGRNLRLKNRDFIVDLGFTDDMKVQISSHQYELIVLNKKKVPINKILFEVQQDGTFLVNNIVSGKF